MTERWTVLHTESGDYVITTDTDENWWLVTDLEPELAAQIVREHNAHAALVEALKGTQSVIEEYRRAFDDYGLFLGDDNKRFDTTIRAALELAKGER